jgi:hypothetical protein
MFRNQLVFSTIMIMHVGGAACLGHYAGWGWYSWRTRIVLAANKGVLHTYARRNCLGREVTEGSYIVRVGVVVIMQKNVKKKFEGSAQLKFIEGVAFPSGHNQRQYQLPHERFALPRWKDGELARLGAWGGQYDKSGKEETET